MELFERIRYISKIKGVSLAQIAKEFKLAPQTFHHWLDAKSQKNLWEHLPKIMEIFPDVRRDWLYFGEGEMLATDSAPAVSSQQPTVQSAEVTRLLSELEEERRLNRQLVTRLLVDGAGDKSDSKNMAVKVVDGQ